MGNFRDAFIEKLVCINAVTQIAFFHISASTNFGIQGNIRNPVNSLKIAVLSTKEPQYLHHIQSYIYANITWKCSSLFCTWKHCIHEYTQSYRYQPTRYSLQTRNMDNVSLLCTFKHSRLTSKQKTV